MADTTISIVALLKDRFSGTFGKIGAGFGALDLRLRSIGQTAGAALGRVGSLAGGVAAAVSAARSIAAAEESTQAEQQLLAALRGRLAMSEKILATTRSIQKAQGLSDDQLNKTAAVMLRVGVNAQKIPAAITVASDASFAFGESVEAIAEDLARLDQGGQARLLTRYVPELKEAIKEGRTFEEQLEIIRARVSGAGAAAGQTIFGRIAAEQQELGDVSERIGGVLARIKLAIVQGITPAVEAFARAVESPAFLFFVDLFERFAPTLVPVAAGLALIASAIGSLAIAGSILGPLISTLSAIAPLLSAAAAAVGPLLAGIASIAGPLGIVIGLATALGVAFGVALFAATDTLDDLVGMLKAIPGLFARAAESAFLLLKKVAEGKLDIQDLFDVVQTRLRQGVLLIDAFLVTPIRQFFSAAYDTVAGFFSIVPNLAGVAVTRTQQFAQRTFLGFLTFVSERIDTVLNSVDEVLKGVDEIAGTKLSFGGSDIASLIPDDFVDLAPIADQFDRELRASVDKFQNSLSRAGAVVATNVSLALAGVAIEEDRLTKRLAESEENHLRDRAARIDKEVVLEQRKGAKILAETLALRRRIEATLTFDRVLVDATTLIDLSPEKIRELFRGLDEEQVEPIKNLVDRQVTDALARGKIAVEQFLKLKRELEVGVLEDQVRGQEQVRRAQEETLAGLDAQLTAVRALLVDETDRANILAQFEGNGAILEETQKRRLDLAKQETELVGQINDATSLLVDSDERRQEIVAKMLGKERDLSALRLDFATRELELLKGEREELAKTSEAVAAAVQSQAISRNDGIFKLEHAVARFEAQVRGAEKSVTDLLDVPGATADQIEDLRTLLEQIQDVALITVRVRASLDVASVEATLEKARTELEESFAKRGRAVELGELDPGVAAEQAIAEVRAFQARVELLEGALAALELAPGVSQETLDKIDTLQRELQETGELKVDPRLGLADSIARQADEARAVLETKLRDIAEDVDRGVRTTGQGAQAGRSAFDEYSAAIERSLAALQKIAAEAPELGAEIEDLTRRIRQAREEAEPKADTSGDFLGGLKQGVDDSITRLSDLEQTGRRVGTALTEDLADGLVDVFIRGAQSFGDFVRQFVAGIAIMIAKALLFRAISGALGGIGLPIGAGASQGGDVDAMYHGEPTRFLKIFPHAQRYRDGGGVPGTDTGRDTVPALLRPKEWVIRPEATGYYGGRIMAMINTMTIPREWFSMLGVIPPVPLAASLAGRFAGGGEVGGPIATSSSLGRASPAYVPGNEESLERMLHGGAPGLWRFLGSNRDMARAALGL